MTIELSSIIGYFAAFLTTVAFIPQAYQSWKTRELSGISLPMYTLFTSGVSLWLVYGFYIDSMPIVIANAITLVLSTIVLTLKSIEVFSKK
jgi:MtN3 and saliva related transmembrane protein